MIQRVKQKIKSAIRSWGLSPLAIRYYAKKQKSVLICGPRKSGNTWCRFVIFNYYNVKMGGGTKTLTYDELNYIQSNTLKTAISDLRASSIRGVSLPFFCRTHSPYYKLFDTFDIVIYVWRNPLDTLISEYYWKRNRVDLDFKNVSVDSYVLNNIVDWIWHYKRTIKKVDIDLNYENRKRDAFFEYERLIKTIEGNCDIEALRKAIDLSSIDSVREMGRESGQKAGMHKKMDTSNFEFARSGGISQYEKELSIQTIRKCKSILIDKGVECCIL